MRLNNLIASLDRNERSIVDQEQKTLDDLSKNQKEKTDFENGQTEKSAESLNAARELDLEAFKKRRENVKVEL